MAIIVRKTRPYTDTRFLREHQRGVYLMQRYEKGTILRRKDKSRLGDFIVEGVRYQFPKKPGKPGNEIKGLFLFGMVKRDAESFLSRRPVPYFKEYPANYKNIEYKYSSFGAVDLNHAWWRIAYMLGIISETTYAKGLPSAFKTLRNSTLSTLGRPKTYEKWHAGENTGTIITFGENADLRHLYMWVRHTCFRYMWQLHSLLGDNFAMYKTDCIYFRDTKKNRVIVHAFLNKRGLAGKDLYI